MKQWEKFENDTTQFLQEALGEYDVIIKQFGNADSTLPDIEISLKNTGSNFFIETKMPSSQTSQFVVDIYNNKFIYGTNNKFKANAYSDDIIQILNENYSLYKNVSQSGMIVPVPDTIAFGWIVSNIKNKNVEFIMSIDSNSNERIIPIELFSNFFNVKTILRRKKSGSTSLPQKYYKDFENAIKGYFKKYKIFVDNSRLYVLIDKNLSKSECYFESSLFKNKKYFLSKKENNIYEVKLTSSTNNPNIIFELSVKDNIDEDMFTIQTIIEFIENYFN